MSLTLSPPPIPLRLYTLPYWSNPFLIFWHLGALALRTERQSARMSKIKNGRLDQYGAEPCKQQQFGTAGVEGVKCINEINALEVGRVCIHQEMLAWKPCLRLKAVQDDLLDVLVLVSGCLVLVLSSVLKRMTIFYLGLFIGTRLPVQSNCLQRLS